MSTLREKAESAWLEYRDHYLVEHFWCSPRRAGRQLRKRDFIAGYEKAVQQAKAEALREAADEVDVLRHVPTVSDFDLSTWLNKRADRIEAGEQS